MATAATPSYASKSEPLTKRKSWMDLQHHHEEVRGLHLKKLFAEDPQRGERMTAEAVGIFLDYSKNRITDKPLSSSSSSRKSPAFARTSTGCFAARKSTSPRSARCCI